jgi:hypothetical protein
MRLSSTRKNSLGNQRGAAATEMALMMIILVPLLLFVAYTSDAVFHQLDVQEAVIGTTWDFSTARFGFRCEGGSGGNANACKKARLSDDGESVGKNIAGPNMANSPDSIAGYNRQEYADHDSSYSNHPRVNQGSWMDEEHHTQAFGQVSWCDGNECKNHSAYSNMTSGQQIFCKINRGVSGEKFSLDVLQGSNQLQSTSEGGVVECWAKGWLMNYVVGDKFLGDFPGVEKVKLFNKKRHTGNVHAEHSTGGSGASADVLLRYRAGLMVDSWAALDHWEKDGLGGNSNKHRDTELGKENTLFFKRTEDVFQNSLWYLIAVGGVANYAGQAASKKLAAITFAPYMGPTIVSGIPEFIVPPNPVGLWMVSTAHKNKKHTSNLKDYEFKPDLDIFGKKLMTTPFYDEFKSAWQARGNNYLGAKSPESM